VLGTLRDAFGTLKHEKLKVRD